MPPSHRRLVLLLASLLVAPCTSPAALPLPKAAIYPLAQIGTDSSSAQVLTEALAMEVLRTGQARVMERSQIQAILAEQGFTQSGACSANECAVEIGRLLGVDRMVVGSLGKVDDVVVLNARLIDMSTGEVLSVASRRTRNGVAGLLGADVTAIAQELMSEKSIPLARSTPVLPSVPATEPTSPAPRASSKPQIAWSRFAPQELQVGFDLTALPTTRDYYDGVALGLRFRPWWSTPLPVLAIAPGLWYVDNLDRHKAGMFGYGASLALRLLYPLAAGLELESRAEQTFARFQFDDPSGTADPYNPAGYGDRWEPLTSLDFGVRVHSSLPVDLGLSYGPAVFDYTLVHRFELAATLP